MFPFLFLMGFFWDPALKLSSGKTITVTGKGSPILFSTGLFGTMPKFIYSEFINGLKRNISVVTIDGFSPISKNDLDEVCATLQVDKIGLLTHSSFVSEILNSDVINSAVLLDPITLPSISINGLNNPSVNNDYPTLIIKSEKLYDGKRTIPEWQNPDFNENIIEETINGVGHPDILDNTWANVAKQTNLWDMAEGKTMKYSDWKLNIKNSIPSIRREYRKYLNNKIIDFFNENKDYEQPSKLEKITRIIKKETNINKAIDIDIDYESDI